jgi:hypothetical protein
MEVMREGIEHWNMAGKGLQRQKEWERGTPRACAPWSYMPKHFSPSPRSPLELSGYLDRPYVYDL